MARNPNWTRDELILALDLYFTCGRTQPDRDHPEVNALSELLNDLPIHPPEDKTESFRNPAGVSMKLGNFLRLDPTYDGAGLPRGGKLDQQVWEEFANQPTELHRIAQAIRSTYDTDEAQAPTIDADEPEEIFREGAILTRVHRRRERDPRLIKRKKERVLRETGQLACEIRGFDFEETYGELGKGFAECHHIVPLANLTENHRIRLADLAIVCANCHRMLHRDNPSPSPEELRAIFKLHRQNTQEDS